MPQDTNDIYRFLKANNLTDKDEKTFLNEYSNPQKAKEIYSFFKANNLTDKDESVFYDTYLKKKEPSQSSGGVSQQNGYDSMLSPFQQGIESIQQPQVSKKPKPKSNQFINIGEEDASSIKRPQQVKLSAVNYDSAVDTALKKRGIDKNNPSYKIEAEKLYKKVREGELVGHKKENGEDVLLRGEGFGESLVNTISRSAHDTKEAFKINSITDPKELAQYFQNNPTEEQESKPSGIGGELGELIGGVVKPGVLLAANAVAPGVGTGIMAAEATYSAMGRQKRELFDRGLLEGLTPEEAAKKAMETAPISAIPEGVMAAALGTNLKGLGNVVNKAADEGFKKALTNSIKSVAKVSAGGGATELASTGIQSAKGYNITPIEALERSWNSATGWAKMDAAFKILGMAGAAPKYLKSAAKEYIYTLPKEDVSQFKDQLPLEERSNIDTQLSNYETARKQVEGLVPEENMSTFAGLVEKRNNLEKSKEGKAKSLSEPIQKEIGSIDERLGEMQRTGKVVEVDDITGEQTTAPKKHEELTKQEREGIVVPKEYGNAEVIEKGEGENKTFRPEATYIVKEGGLEKSVKIKIDDEGKAYTSKEAAQKAADEALAKHFYENQMPDYDKPEAKEVKIQQSPKTESTTVEEVNPIEQSTEEGLYKSVPGSEPKNKFPLPEKPIEDMTSLELKEYAKKVKEYDRAIDKELFDGVKTDEKERNLTKEQSDEYYGMNLPKDGVYDHTEILRMRERISGIEESESARDLAEWIKRPIIQFARGKLKEDLGVINAARRRAEELGISNEELLKETLQVVASDFKNKGDAELAIKEVISGISKPEPTIETKQISEPIKPTENAIQERSTEKAIMDEASRDSEKMGERVSESGETSKEGKQIEGNEGVIPPTEPPVTETTTTPKEPRFNDKSILKRLTESENIRPETREKFKENLKYKVKSQEEARTVAKDIIKEYDIDEAVTLAESGKFHGDVNSMIFGEALDNLYRQEQEAKTPQEKLALAERWADVSMRYDEAARSGGRFISAIADFYKKSPLGIRLKEEANRNEAFKEWFKNKETNYKEVFEALREEPEFKNIIKEQVQAELKKERSEYREKRRKNIEDFFDKAKFKGDATYATIIPPKVINGGIEAMKQAFLAGESVVSAVEKAIDYISTEIKDWDKEKFRKEWEEKLRQQDGGKKSKLTDEELTEQKKQRLLDRFRKKLKGLSEKEKEEVIRKSFKKLVENGALEYEDFKDIIKQTLGLGELTQEQKTKIDQYVKDINQVEDFAEKARTERTDKSLSDFHAAAKKAERSATELGQIVYNKPNIIRRLNSIMQLNTLGIPSLVNNPIFNIFNQAFVRFPKAVQLSLIDKAIQGVGKVFGRDWQPNTNVVSAQKPFFKGVAEGAKQSAEQMVTGLTNKDYFQKEVYTTQIHPFTSAKELWEFAKGDKHLSRGQVIDKGLQATFGLPAEAVARSLNIGDKPQRYAAERATAQVIADQYGLKGMDAKLFMEFPKKETYRLEIEKGLSEEAAMKKAEEIEKRIISEGEESTFQQDNIINEAINAIGVGYDRLAEGKAPLEMAGKLGSIFKTMNLPFVKIPLNAYWSYFNLVNPEIAGAQSLIYGATAAYKKAKGIDGWQKDFEQSKKWLAHATTGMAMLAATGILAKNSIVTGDNSARDTKKEREGEKNYEQQHSLNLGKLQAYLSGRNPDEVTEGLNVDLKWFGVLGNALNLQANKLEELTPEQRANGATLMEDMLSNLNQSSLEMFENGVFSNTSSLFNAINNGGAFADSYMMNLINMGSNIIHPAMFAQMSRAQLPQEYTTKADSFMEQLKSNMSARSSLVRELTGKYPPSKIGIWGDKLDRNDNWMLKWFGMSRYNKDNFAQSIYEDYKRTGNTKFFPPSVKPEINDQKLNVEQTRQLEELTGHARKNLVAPYVNDMATLPGFNKKYSELTDEEKVKALEILYSEGSKNAKEQFLKIHPEFEKDTKLTKDQKKQRRISERFREKVKND